MTKKQMFVLAIVAIPVLFSAVFQVLSEYLLKLSEFIDKKCQNFSDKLLK